MMFLSLLAEELLPGQELVALPAKVFCWRVDTIRLG